MVSGERFQPMRRNSILVLFLLLSLLSFSGARPVRAADDNDDNNDRPADITVAVQARPGITVTPGSTVAFEFSARNFGRGDASRVQVDFGYNPDLLTVQTSSFQSSDDWVSDLDSDEVELTFGELEADETRFATIYMRVADNLPVNTVIQVRPTFEWEDINEQNDKQDSNQVALTVGTANADSPYLAMQFSPDRGPAGTVYTFYSDRFVPDEPISTWLNTPQGVQSTGLNDDADNRGRVALSFSSSGLAPGEYQLVVSGVHSKLLAVAPFTVTP